MDSNEWLKQAENIFELIQKEMQDVSSESRAQVYPKLVVMYEFFRMLRGEAFLRFRPQGVGEGQQKLYGMGDQLSKQLLAFRKSLNPADEKTAFYINEAKKNFDI